MRLPGSKKNWEEESRILPVDLGCAILRNGKESCDRMLITNMD